MAAVTIPQFGYGCDDACLFDSEAPEFTEVPEDMNVSCSADISVVMPAATDNCDQDLTFTYNDRLSMALVVRLSTSFALTSQRTTLGMPIRSPT